MTTDNSNNLHPWHFVLEVKPEIIRGVCNDWNALLGREDATERELHKFIREHAGFFWGASNRIPFIISEFYLGTDFRADLVIPQDRASNGFWYTLIELEDKSSKLFSERKTPSRRLSDAVRQTIEWRHFLETHQQVREELFPASIERTSPMFHLEFLIIMGRRNHEVAEWRNYFANSNRIEIRSYDFLTDQIGRNVANSFYIQDCAAKAALSKYQLNQLANPFVQAVSFSDWKRLCKGDDLLGHAVANNCETILRMLRHNSQRLAQFLKLEEEAEKEFGPWSECGFFS